MLNLSSSSPPLPHLSLIILPFTFLPLFTQLHCPVSPSRHDSLQSEVGDISYGSIRLSSDVDNYSALLLEAVAKCEETASNLADSTLSVEALKKEKHRVKTESNRLRNESQVIYSLSQSYTEKGQKPYFAQIELPNYPPPFPLHGSDKENDNKKFKIGSSQIIASVTSSSSSAFVHTTAIEVRVALMKQMEDLYQDAVLTQSAAKREIESLQSAARKAAAECARSKAEVLLLDEKIEDLKNRC